MALRYLTRHLTIAILSGDKTCSYGGRSCAQLRTTHGGSRATCNLFNAEPLDERGGFDGPLQRLPQCIEAEKA